MSITVRPYEPRDLAACTSIWNEVLEEGLAFPGEELFDEGGFAAFLATNDLAACAVGDGGRVLGFYVIHPNNIGRCSHVANASYCVSSDARGMGVGRLLVPASLRDARTLGYRGMQFNAVVKGNVHAVHLYQTNGFSIVGTVPGGFRLKDGSYSDMYVMYRDLADI